MSDTAVPNPSALVTRVVDELKARFVGHLLAGLGYFVALFAAILLLVLLFGLGAIPGAVMQDETVLSIGMAVTGLLFYVPGLVLITVVAAPAMNASLMRAIWAAWHDDGPLGFTSSFSTVRQDLKNVVIVTFLYQMAIFVGALFCYVPGIVLAVLLCHAVPLTVLHGVAPMDALKMSFEKVKENAAYHVIGFLIFVGVAIVLEITVIGVMLILPLQFAMLLMMYEEMFGKNGPEGRRGSRVPS